MSAFDVGSDGLAPEPTDTPCGQCGHSDAIHFDGATPDALTKQTKGCLYHDSEGPCLCPGWLQKCAECTHRAAVAKHEGKAGFIICVNCTAARARLPWPEEYPAIAEQYPAPYVRGGAPNRVIIESPYGKRPDGSTCTPEEIAENLRYFWLCVKDSLARGEAPFGSHGFYPNVLDDGTPEERTAGILAGFAWAAAGELRAFYLDRGVTPGMLLGRANAIKIGQRVETRRIET